MVLQAVLIGLYRAGVYPLVKLYKKLWKMAIDIHLWLIYPVKNVIFHSYVAVYQRVPSGNETWHWANSVLATSLVSLKIKWQVMDTGVYIMEWGETRTLRNTYYSIISPQSLSDGVCTRTSAHKHEHPQSCYVLLIVYLQRICGLVSLYVVALSIGSRKVYYTTLW